MARRRKEERRVGSACRGMVRRWGRCFSRVRHRGIRDRERVPERCHAWGAAVDVCSDTPAWAQRAEGAADGGVVYVARASLGRHVHRALWRSVWLDVTPIIAATACYQRNDVERYSRSMQRKNILMKSSALICTRSPDCGATPTACFSPPVRTQSDVAPGANMMGRATSKP
jgi:hypothetical protein